MHDNVNILRILLPVNHQSCLELWFVSVTVLAFILLEISFWTGIWDCSYSIWIVALWYLVLLLFFVFIEILFLLIRGKCRAKKVWEKCSAFVILKQVFGPDSADTLCLFPQNLYAQGASQRFRFSSSVEGQKAAGEALLCSGSVPHSLGLISSYLGLPCSIMSLHRERT